MMMIQIKFYENISLPDKVGGMVIGDFQKCQCHLMFKKAPHETIYCHEKKVCLEYYIAIGSHYVQ